MELDHLISTILLIVFLEVFLYRVICFLKQDFPWIITKPDIKPIISHEQATRFFANSFHEKYGWLRESGSKFSDISEGKKSAIQ